jgi:hypothetical protein
MLTINSNVKLLSRGTHNMFMLWKDPFRFYWEGQFCCILLLSVPLWGVSHFYLLSSILPFTKHTSNSLCIPVAVIVTWEVVFVFYMGQLVAGCISCLAVKRPVISHRTFNVSHFKTSDIWLGLEIISFFFFISFICIPLIHTWFHFP